MYSPRTVHNANLSKHLFVPKLFVHSVIMYNAMHSVPIYNVVFTAWHKNVKVCDKHITSTLDILPV